MLSSFLAMATALLTGSSLFSAHRELCEHLLELGAVLGFEILDLRVRDDVPLRDHDDALTARLHFAQDVRGEDDRVLTGASELDDHVPHLLDLDRIEADGGLVED